MLFIGDYECETMYVQPNYCFYDRYARIRTLSTRNVHVSNQKKPLKLICES